MRNIAKRTIGGMEIELINLPSLDQLELEWRDLERRSDISFFTSWSWIGAWLHTLPASVHPMLLRAHLHGKTMGLGVLVGSVMLKAKCVPVKVWRLNETGRSALDKITIEYNGLVIDDGVQHVLEPMMVQYLMDHRGNWDELQFNALRRPTTTRLRMPKSSMGISKTRITKLRQPAYQVCLTDTRNAGSHLQLIKQKARYHIRRSLSTYEKIGPVTLTVASTLDQALSFLERLKHFHRAHWADKPGQGAFNHPFFNGFHDHLIRSCFDRGEIQIIAIRAGSQEVAYLYNFVWNGHVYNYQSGVNYPEMGGKLSPGMVAHSLTIEHNAAMGHHTYDLMAGEHQYKRALTLQTVQLDWWAARRPTLPVHAEDSVRGAAKLAKQMSGLAQETALLRRRQA